eukprot:5324762-Pleurochrysis_carterae.AAC.1
MPLTFMGLLRETFAVEVQGFTLSELDPCYFVKKYDEEHRIDLVLYVDDCWMADTGCAKADDDLRLFCERFKLTMQDKPKQFLGVKNDIGNDDSVKVSAAAYNKAKAEFYLQKPLAEYPRFETPSTPQLVKDYEIAVRKEHYVEGAQIYATPCGRPGEAFTIGILARALAFPTIEMDEHANRVLAYMAQNVDGDIEFKPGGRAELVAYSDSDWAVAHSTTGFCVTYGGVAIFFGSKRQHCISLSSTKAEIVAASHTAAE